MSIGATSSRPAPNLANRDLLDGEDYFEYGVPLYEASILGDWKSAKAILDKKPELVMYSLTQNGETALHVAVSAKRSKQVVEFVKNLVDKMTKEDLELVNNNHNTALYLAAAARNLETVKIMVEKNRALLTIPGDGGKMMPLYAAALFGDYEVVKYLYHNSHGLHDDGWTDTNRGWLLEKCVESDMFDIAMDIVKRHPTVVKSNTLLKVLARKPRAFLKEEDSNIITRIVDSVRAFIGMKVVLKEEESQALLLLRILWEDIVKLPKRMIDDLLRGPPDLMEPAKGWALQAIQLKELISEQLEELEKIYPNEHQVPELKKIVSRYVLKMHTETQNIIKEENRTRSSEGDQALELEKIISENIVKLHDDTQKSIKQGTGVKVLHGLISNHISVMRRESSLRETYSSQVLFVAAEMGNTSFIVELIRRYPDLIWMVNDDNLSIFHIAVQHRHTGIYNILYEIGAMKDMITPMKDKNNNNMLHFVGKIAKPKRFAEESGVIYALQRDLLWFLEVESMIPPSLGEQRNSDGLTPYELFKKEHNDMVTCGEKWMKEMATQCIVVSALIATMVFAAAFTVPGGYDQNNGIPIFYSKTTFKVFVVANAISLLSSSASILFMFSYVFTSRFAEIDFLEALPAKLMAGLSFLFLSLTTMMIAFSVSFFVLYQKGLLWIPILISGFALIPFSIYSLAQYTLFADIIRLTFGNRYLFNPLKPVLYYKNPTV